MDKGIKIALGLIEEWDDQHQQSQIDLVIGGENEKELYNARYPVGDVTSDIFDIAS